MAGPHLPAPCQCLQAACLPARRTVAGKGLPPLPVPRRLPYPTCLPPACPHPHPACLPLTCLTPCLPPVYYLPATCLPPLVLPPHQTPLPGDRRDGWLLLCPHPTPPAAWATCRPRGQAGARAGEATGSPTPPHIMGTDPMTPFVTSRGRQEGAGGGGGGR